MLGELIPVMLASTRGDAQVDLRSLFLGISE